MPAPGKGRRQANWAGGPSNLRQMYIAFQLYSTESKGWLCPVGQPVNAFGVPNPDGTPETYGTNYPPHLLDPSANLCLHHQVGPSAAGSTLQHRTPTRQYP